MKEIVIDYDLAGYAYDPDRPTEQAEKLFFKLNKILDDLKTAGVSLRMTEETDITEAETYVAGIYEAIATPPVENPTLETPEHPLILSDPGIYGAVSSARSAWLKGIVEAVAGEDPASNMGRIAAAAENMLLLENVVYLSDGTPIYGSTGLVA
jgi:hypothetical protein